MNLHAVTIRTTLLLLIASIVVPNTCVLIAEGCSANFSTITASFTTIGNILFGMTVLWLFSGSPLLVSFFVARKMQYGASDLILLVSTVAYGILFVYSQFQYLVGSGGCMRAFWLMTPFASLWWMIPAWIFASVLNSRHIKNV